jgi:hypothetical protein
MKDEGELDHVREEQQASIPSHKTCRGNDFV